MFELVPSVENTAEGVESKVVLFELTLDVGVEWTLGVEEVTREDLTEEIEAEELAKGCLPDVVSVDVDMLLNELVKREYVEDCFDSIMVEGVVEDEIEVFEVRSDDGFPEVTSECGFKLVGTELLRKVVTPVIEDSVLVDFV